MVLAQKVKEMATGNDGEIVPWNEDVREEALRRNVKAGYCNSEGGPVGATKIMITLNWGKRKLNIWPRDENGELIE